MKKRNKKYVPKKVILNPMTYIIGGMRKAIDAESFDVKIKNEASLLKLKLGEGTKDDFDNMVAMCNVTIVMTELYFTDEYKSMLLAARDVLHNIGARYLKSGVFALEEGDLQAISDAIEVHNAQIDQLRVIDVERAVDEVQRRLNHRINIVKIANSV